MLRKRDIELIAGLVEGTLEDESQARALLDRSAEARAEYETQRTTYQALRSVAPASLSDQERADLRRELWSELRSDPSPARSRTPWSYRLAPVAAALVLVVGVLALLDGGFEGADEAADAPTDVAGQLSADTTAAAGSGVLESADDGAAEPAAEGDGGADLTDEQAIPETRSSEDFFSMVSELVRSQEWTQSTTDLRFFAADTDLQDATGCVETAGLVGYEIVAEASNTEEKGAGTENGSYLVLVPQDTEIGTDTEITFVSTSDCEVVHIEG